MKVHRIELWRMIWRYGWLSQWSSHWCTEAVVKLKPEKNSGLNRIRRWSFSWSSWNWSVLSLLRCVLFTQHLTCLSVSAVMRGPNRRFTLLDLQLWKNLATHDVIRMVRQNPSFCRTWWRLSSVSTATETTSFTSFSSASVSLLGPICTDAGHISGLESQSGPFSHSSGSFLDSFPCFPDLLDFSLSSHGPLNVIFSLDLLHSISYKLFVVSFTSHPVKGHHTVCSPIHWHHCTSLQCISHILDKIGCHMNRHEF